MASDAEKLALLERFADAWNAHDVDALMACMSDACEFRASSGPDANGRSYKGRDAVRAGYAAIFEAFPDARWNEPRHAVSGNRGLSEWRFTGTGKTGNSVEVDGCDLFVFEGPLIALKDSYRKSRI